MKTVADRFDPDEYYKWRNQQWKIQEGRCYYCGDSLKGVEYHADHKQPTSRHGEDSLSNLCLACPHCNLSKGARTEEEYWQYKYDLRWLWLYNGLSSEEKTAYYEAFAGLRDRWVIA